MIKDVIDKIKAKITGKPAVIGADLGKPGGDHTAELKITIKSGEMKVEELQGLGKSINEQTEKLIEKEWQREKRQNTNNWRKMHNLPMRRKRGSRKRRK